MRDVRAREFLLFVSGLLPLLTIPWLGFTWLIYTLFAFFYRFRERFWATGWFDGGLGRYVLTGLTSAYLLEILAVIDNLKREPSERILLNPSPPVDIYLALAYYTPFILYWGLVLRKYDYSPRDVFILGGVSGIFMEQTGAVFLSLNILAWFYVFLVYGSYKAIPAFLHWQSLRKNRRKNLSTENKILLGMGVEALAFVSAALLLKVFALIGGIK